MSHLNHNNSDLTHQSYSPFRGVGGSELFLVIDQSTSATKALLFNQKGQLVARVSEEHQQFYPQPGWVEHDPIEILENTYKAVEKLVRENIADNDKIVSVAITNQRETVLVWDKYTGKPVYNAVVWQCNRGTQICNEFISKGYQSKVTEKTGLIISPYFSASGVQWILDNVPNAREKAEDGQLLMGTIDSWLIWNLTAEKNHATDYTNASRTLLFNINTLNWDKELLDLFTIPASMMPNVTYCDEIFGTTTFNGLTPEIPIAGVLGDSHGALAGQMCFKPGMGKATYGTGSSIMINIGEKALPAPRGLVTSVAFAAGGKVYYAFEGNIHCTGATIKWLQDDLKLIESANETEELATSVESTDGVYFVPAFAGLGAPWWDNEAKALICGMNRGTNKAHIVRAALESIAYQVKDLMDLIQTYGVELSELRVDGGPVKNNFLMQFQADMLQAKINRSPIQEASAFGAFLISGLAMKTWKSLSEIEKLRTENDYIEPKMKIESVNNLYSGWQNAIKKSKTK